MRIDNKIIVDWLTKPIPEICEKIKDDMNNIESYYQDFYETNSEEIDISELCEVDKFDYMLHYTILYHLQSQYGSQSIKF